MQRTTVDMDKSRFVLKGILLLALVVGVWFARGIISSWMTHDARMDASVANASTTFRVASNSDLVMPQDVLNGDFISVDVDAKRVMLYRDAKEFDTVPIVHVPDQSSPDALAPGSFVIDTVTDVEVSTITMVRYPHYVKFGDRYALHGESSNTKFETLPNEYPGNSVLLSFADAEKVEAFARVGMVVYVSTRASVSSKASSTIPVRTEELPATTASAYALRDMASGQTYLVRGGDERYPIASITKLITAVVAGDAVGHGTQVLAPNGEHYTLGDLLYPLLLRSDNEVAERIASHAGHDAFIAHMNAYVHAIGMQSSRFVDSSGLLPGNVSTAIDLLTFAQHLYDKKQYLLGVAGEDSVVITSTEGNDRLVVNQNKLANDPHFRGGKLGYTDEAGQTSLAILDIPIGTSTRSVAVVVLGSKDWKQDTRTLLRWLAAATDTHVSS